MIEVVIHQRQLRAHAFVKQRGAFLAIARGPDLATPAAEQAVHTDQDAVLVVDTQHLRAIEQFAIEFGDFDRRCGLRPGQRHADAEHATASRPRAYAQGMTEHAT